MNVEPVGSGAARPENPPSLNPFCSSGASLRRTSAITVATETAGRVDGGSVALAVVLTVLLDAPAAWAAELLGVLPVVDAALAAIDDGWVRATAPAGSGSGTGASASMASSRADICPAYPSAWSKVVEADGPLKRTPIRCRPNRKT